MALAGLARVAVPARELGRRRRRPPSARSRWRSSPRTAGWSPRPSGPRRSWRARAGTGRAWSAWHARSRAEPATLRTPHRRCSTCSARSVAAAQERPADVLEHLRPLGGAARRLRRPALAAPAGPRARGRRAPRRSRGVHRARQRRWRPRGGIRCSPSAWPTPAPSWRSRATRPRRRSNAFERARELVAGARDAVRTRADRAGLRPAPAPRRPAPSRVRAAAGSARRRSPRCRPCRPCVAASRSSRPAACGPRRARRATTRGSRRRRPRSRVSSCRA